MNCPQCHEPIGAANYKLGEWSPIENERGVTIGVEREIKLHCGHCGTFTATQDQDNHITKISGPIAGRAALSKAESDIPGCQREFVRLSA